MLDLRSVPRLLRGLRSYPVSQCRWIERGEGGLSASAYFPRVECHFRLKRVSLDLNPLLRENSILTPRESEGSGQRRLFSKIRDCLLEMDSLLYTIFCLSKGKEI